MITKQQALEFIDELSKLHVVHLDIPCGYAYIDREEYEYRAWADGHTLEALVTEIIKDNMGNALLMDFNKIPVDVDMLEVGQTYKVHIQEDWEHRYFTAKFLGFDEDDVVKFEDNKPCTKFDFREIYKVNEYANM